MPSVTITSPTSGSTVAHTFPAGGGFDIADLDQGENAVNTVQSSVTQNGNVLDTKVYTIPGGVTSGAWGVTHVIPGSRVLTGCVVTALLLVDAIEVGSASVTNITISG
jgi:hypothetical protein